MSDSNYQGNGSYADAMLLADQAGCRVVGYENSAAEATAAPVSLADAYDEGYKAGTDELPWTNPYRSAHRSSGKALQRRTYEQEPE